MPDPKQIEASRQLEELKIVLPEAINALREGLPPRVAYALVYEMRAELSKIVRTLGAGTPTAFQRDKATLIFARCIEHEDRGR